MNWQLQLTLVEFFVKMTQFFQHLKHLMKSSNLFESGLLVTRSVVLSFAMLTLLACADPPPLVPPTPLSSVDRTIKPVAQWRKSVGERDKRGSGRFRPYIDQSGVFAASVDGIVAAYESDGGKRLWRRDLATRLGSGVGGDQRRVYVASRDGMVMALDKTSGETVWTYAMPSAVLVRPVASADDASQDNSLVVVRASNGNVRGLDGESGEELWSTNFDTPALTVHGYGEPVVLNSGVLVGLEDGKLVALSRSNGSLLWQSVVSFPSGGSEIERLVDLDANILVDDAFIYVVTYQGRLARVEPRRGTVIWSVPMSSVSGMAQDDSNLYLTLDDSTVVGVSKEGGEELWRLDALRGRSLTRPGLVRANVLAVVDFEGFMHVIDAQAGTIVGRSQPLQSAPHSPALVVADIARGEAASKDSDSEESASATSGRIFLQSVGSELVALRLSN